MSIKTDALVIRNETVDGANTALRVGQTLSDIADDLIAKQAVIDTNTAKTGITTTQANDIIANNAKVGITTTQASNITTNNAKVSNIDHPLVEKAVPSNAVFTDTVYDDATIQAEVDLNTAKTGITTQQASDITSNNAKVSNVDHPLVETAVPSGAVFTDTVYNDTDVLKDADVLSPITAGNKLMTQDDVAGLGGGDMLSSTYDPIINANTAKVSNVDHPLVEKAVPSDAVFTDTVYNDTAIQSEVDLNTAKVSNIAHPLVETAVPVGALFTDTIYDDTTIQAEVDLNTAKTGITAQQSSDITTNNAKVGVTTEEANTIDSIATETGANQVLNVVSITQAAYDLLTPISTTLYVING